MKTPPQDSPPPYSCIIFDCDSTLSEIEGIDELAGSRRAEICALTDRAMAGELPLEEVYGARLALLQPDRNAVARVAKLYLEHALPHAAQLIHALRSLGKRVAVVSGGLRAAVEPFATALGVDRAEVHAVDIHFDESGCYAGFDSSSPLARSGGKPPVVAQIVAQSEPHGAALIGDGVTDLEAAGEVDRFIAFAGVADRTAVTTVAVQVARGRDLAGLLPLLLTDEERALLAVDTSHAALLAASHSKP